MKNNNEVKTTIWEKIKNGIKRAIKFVIDIVLFVPRVLFYGVSSVLCKMLSPTKSESDDDCWIEEKSTNDHSTASSQPIKDNAEVVVEDNAEVVVEDNAEVVVEDNAEVVVEDNAEPEVTKAAAAEVESSETLPVVTDDKHIHELRKDDIGVLELSVLDNMEYAGSDQVFNVPDQFVHPDKWGESTHVAMCSLLQAWCDRLDITYPAFDGTYQPYMSMINSLKELGELTEEEVSGVTARVGRYYTPNYLEASRIHQIIFNLMCKYFKKFYGTWVLYEEFNEQWFKLRKFFNENKPLQRYTKEEALKYFPLDESLKGINNEAPFCIGILSGKCPELEKQR